MSIPAIDDEALIVLQPFTTFERHRRNERQWREEYDGEGAYLDSLLPFPNEPFQGDVGAMSLIQQHLQEARDAGITLGPDDFYTGNTPWWQWEQYGEELSCYERLWRATWGDVPVLRDDNSWKSVVLGTLLEPERQAWLGVVQRQSVFIALHLGRRCLARCFGLDRLA